MVWESDSLSGPELFSGIRTSYCPFHIAASKRVKHRSTRETILGCPLSSLVFERVGPSAVGFSLANLSPGLIHHHSAALHDPFLVVQSTLISALTGGKV